MINSTVDINKSLNGNMISSSLKYINSLIFKKVENGNTKIFDGFESEDIWIFVGEVLIKYVFDREGVVGS